MHSVDNREFYVMRYIPATDSSKVEEDTKSIFKNNVQAVFGSGISALTNTYTSKGRVQVRFIVIFKRGQEDPSMIDYILKQIVVSTVTEVRAKMLTSESENLLDVAKRNYTSYINNK